MIHARLSRPGSCSVPPRARSVADAKPQRVTGDYRSTAPLFPDIFVGDTRYVTVGDQADTTLLDLTSATKPRKALPVRGFV